MQEALLKRHTSLKFDNQATEALARRLKLNKTTGQILSAGLLEQISGGWKYETFSKWCTGEPIATCQGTSTDLRWRCLET